MSADILYFRDYHKPAPQEPVNLEMAALIALNMITVPDEDRTPPEESGGESA